MLGIGEANYLKGDKRNAERAFLDSLRLADSCGFKIEKGYAEMLLRMFKRGKGFPVNLP